MKNKKYSWLRLLIILATILSGFLAGGNVDRYVVQVPAFRHVDILCWAKYSLYGDMGNGFFLYPFEAIISFLLLVTASIIVVSDRILFKRPALAIYSASSLAFLGLFFTVFAAPIMLSTRTMSNDPISLQHAFNQFHLWGFFRAIVQVLSFCACVIALSKIFSLEI